MGVAIIADVSSPPEKASLLLPFPLSFAAPPPSLPLPTPSIYPEGCVTTFEPRDLPYLKSALEAPASSLYTPAAGLTPEYDTVELLSAQFPDLSLEELLKKLDSEARLDGRYFLCKQEQLLETARVLRWVRDEKSSVLALDRV